MPIRGTERGVKTPIRLRVGVDVPRFTGVNTQYDPAAIADHELQLFENGRWSGSDLIARSGLEKVINTPLSGCVDGIYDDREPASSGLLWT